MFNINLAEFQYRRQYNRTLLKSIINLSEIFEKNIIELYFRHIKHKQVVVNVLRQEIEGIRSYKILKWTSFISSIIDTACIYGTRSYLLKHLILS